MSIRKHVINTFEKFQNIVKLLPNILPANLPSGIVSSIGFALAGSDHPILPISVMTTVGLTAFTLIWNKMRKVLLLA